MVRLNLLAIVSLLLAITISCYAQRVSYSGFTLLRAQPQKVNQVHDLKKLMDSQVSSHYKIYYNPKKNIHFHSDGQKY